MAGVSAPSAALLRRYLKNIKKDPSEPKYRRIRVANDRFAAVWAEGAARDLLGAAGWVADPADGGFLILPVAVSPQVFEMLLDAAAPPAPAVAAAPPLPQAASPPPAVAAAAAAERAKKDAVLAKEKAAVAERLRRAKAEKARIKKQLEADREEAARRRARDSHATQRPLGSNVQRYSDIGVDLNKGGG
mmetsp:Transcript_16745/g.43458  ORF Transcript_16745/g.43458 Transcript_16745/m.43458 type:complete len:189 (-) Transcript_16745:382-948(-)